MSDHRHWRDLIVTLDDEGLEVLARAGAAAIESLRRPTSGPRSNWTAPALRHLVESLEICPDDGVDLNTVLADFGSTVWSHGVVPSDPSCVAHLHPPTLVPSVVTELAIGASNQSMDSWDQSPAATEVELHLMSWLASLIGLSETGSGVMTSGGTASNVLGLTLARSFAGAKLNVDVLKSGLPPQSVNWRILSSDQAHFSVQRAAAQLGLGRDAVSTVASTSSGAMDIVALDDALGRLTRAGLLPIAIVATAGTTDLGAIDPLGEIAARARAHGAWFHVDAAVAGAFLLSDRLRTSLSGIDLADSVTIDFHKLWWQPFNASALIVRDKASFNLLRVKSKYLDRGDELEGMENLVGRSLDTSRRFDAAKVVVSLRTLGRRTLAEMLEHLVDLTRYAGSLVAAHPKLELVAPATSVMCVFDVPGASADDLRRVQQRLLARGEMVLGRTEIKGRAALKFTFMNPLTTNDDVKNLV
ncbi:MAG: pyridoxal phosphate-dependent decarboxylase family protein, partial [Acidimicrobiales bacterium]